MFLRVKERVGIVWCGLSSKSDHIRNSLNIAVAAADANRRFISYEAFTWNSASLAAPDHHHPQQKKHQNQQGSIFGWPLICSGTRRNTWSPPNIEQHHEVVVSGSKTIAHQQMKAETRDWTVRPDRLCLHQLRYYSLPMRLASCRRFPF